jgi:hypothetical protein
VKRLETARSASESRAARATDLTSTALQLVRREENATAAMKHAKLMPPEWRTHMETTIGKDPRATTAPTCELGVFDVGQRQRHDELQRRFASIVEERREVPTGYTFRLHADAGTFLGVAEWITLDRLCCPFMEFRLEWKGGESWLSITGGDGVKEMLTAALAAAR